ncbi:hypothetical protein CERZMDRAFT_103365 [Cercospora zeae-maydis SCOH1-5]|uniref:Uncharacterized protein n=1 Tax=Cercospora zeae-maydis SCOH1-5 TaxID=717836 RepID=A0A6A6EYB9_9PEZI|nr:hypothetical protein CERZMDRAFT_103365 [Cercospora zeae-maydis SCOH1-5]
MSSQQSSTIFGDQPPTKNPDKYSPAIQDDAQALKRETKDFVLENVERARARNQRAKELENDPTLSGIERERREAKLKNSESEFLRFLRR